ncbi:homoserine dehydrogenase [Bacillus sp. FJAT-45037]|uniref:homoserine dehydrogenase n=1 Tax=Bacillus sp. FJAT-45037 TaxID=2011007 RepID=UPI001E406168|nr:homoserine dehydrogenase [Bacillus sp. FJAT-45037]
MSDMLKVGVLGFGTVGSGVYERLEKSRSVIERQLGEPFEVVAILVKDRQKDRVKTDNALITTEWLEFLRHAEYDIVFEAIGGVDPAFSYTKSLLQKGVPVITANKKLVAIKGKHLEELARDTQTFYGYEAAVAGAIPIVNALRGTLATTSIHRVTGILNGTTNYMLTEMITKNRSFADVLLEAQQLGYAESDPTDDIESYDAWYKLAILSRLCFGKWVQLTDFSRIGVTSIEKWHVDVANEIGCQVKLVGDAAVDGNEIIGSVSPAFISNQERLASIHGVTNGIVLYGEDIGELSFIGPGAGGAATANSMVEDFLFHSNYQADRAVVETKEQPALVEECLVFVNQASYGTCLHWAENNGVNIIEAVSHEEGEAWVVRDAPVHLLEQPVYRFLDQTRQSVTSKNVEVL